ncbi:MAG: bifunctional UDP-sugar hydrolase/5'-nucleotidase [Planctomycetota bacterium]
MRIFDATRTILNPPLEKASASLRPLPPAFASHFRRWFYFSLIVCSAIAVLADDSATPKSVKVVILHTNDLHGRAYPQKAVWLDKQNPPEVGGLAALLATIRRERTKAWNDNSAVVLVDAGDWFQGTPEGDLPRGRLVVEWMNLAGYDFATIGNHEFDKGHGTIADLADVAHFPFLGANIRWKSGNRPSWCRATRTFSLSGNRILFVGLITSRMDTLVMPEAIKAMRFDDEITTLKKYLKDDGRIVVPVTHCGVDRDLEIAAATKVPLIIGGHSHTGLTSGKAAPDGTLVCQCFAGGTVLGRAELTLEGGKVVAKSASHVSVRPADGEDAEAKALIARYAKEIDATMNVEIGEAPEALLRGGRGSSPLGNWVCDVMRKKAGAHVALTNRTGIRADLPAGKIRVREMYEISPFSNTLTTMDLTGAELDAILEYSTAENATFLDASGLEAEVDAKGAGGSRVTITKVAGEPWDATRTYKVVTNSFLAAGGDGHGVFKNGKNRAETGIDLLDAQVEACKAAKVVAPAGERIRFK